MRALKEKLVVMSVEAPESAEESAPTCPACGSTRLEFIQGYSATGVTGPNGEPEMYWQEGIRCLDCGETGERW